MEQIPPTAEPHLPLEPGDYYFEGPDMVFTAAYHLKRGFCCGSGCRHCPYLDPVSGPPSATRSPACGEEPAAGDCDPVG